MELQALGKMEWYPERFVKPRREEMKQLVAADRYRVNGVGPIDQHPAPDHHREQRKVEPVQPSDGKRMFVLICFDIAVLIVNR